MKTNTQQKAERVLQARYTWGIECLKLVQKGLQELLLQVLAISTAVEYSLTQSHSNSWPGPSVSFSGTGSRLMLVFQLQLILTYRT